MAKYNSTTYHDCLEISKLQWVLQECQVAAGPTRHLTAPQDTTLMVTP